MTDSLAFETDLSQWPLVIWRMDRILTVAEFQVYLAEADKILARRERFALVVVSQLGSGKSALSGETRKMQANWVKRNFKELEQHCAAMSIVVTDLSPIVHFTVSFLTAVLGRMPGPSKIFTTEADGVAFARQHLLAKTG